jgi:hypothetical protein
MAQFGESGLFERVLRAGNAGSIAFQGVPQPKGPANAVFIVVNLRRLNLLNLGLWSCKSPAPAIPAELGRTRA